MSKLDIKSVDMMSFKEPNKENIDKKENNPDIIDSSDITPDSTNNINDIIIEFEEDIEKANVAVLLRLKPSTVKSLDDLAWKTRQSRNAIAQMLLDKALANVKIKKK